jgi:hypothetical protein
MKEPAAPIELVVAHHREDLSWTANIPPVVVPAVYCKGGAPGRLCTAVLPNVGREAHTYLHHIVERYEELAPLTVFCQGKPFDHCFDFHHHLREMASETTYRPDFVWLGHIVDWDDDSGRRLFAHWSKNPEGKLLPLTRFHEAVFGGPGPATYTFYLGAQFIVRRECVLQRPRDWYRRAMEVAREFPDAAHCFERCWDKVFRFSGVPEPWQGTTQYLKPIKRLKP